MEDKKTKIKIRKGNIEDLDAIYECHIKCFDKSDLWYKSIIQQSLKNSFIIEKLDDKTVIGILLQGEITACESSEINNFIPLNTSGEIFKKNNLHIEPIEGITMLCIDPIFRNKGLAKKLIEIHLNENNNEMVCLFTRSTNQAKQLYLKMGYEHIAYIKSKYFFPTEDAIFMIKN